MRRPYSGGVLRLLACGLLAVALCIDRRCGGAGREAARTPRSSAVSARGSTSTTAPVYAAPERSAQRIAARDVKTVWVETANDGASVDVVNPVQLGRLVDALHARGIRVVAWYLPGHVKPALDLRRSLAMLSFRTPEGGAFDGVALDIESTKLRNVGSSLAASGDARRGSFARPPATRRSRSSRSTRAGSSGARPTWPRFPWAELAESADAFAPMVYTGGALKGFDATYGYVTRALRLLRANTGNPDVPIHVAGGVADRLGPEELAGFVAAVADDGGTIGVSLYDWMTTPPRAWKALAPLTG